ncbi:hypothetical protein FH966_09985 [Lentibacillus cibarius]|uniref:Uncharacterized protein n=1 Tax=Lentibacillus cibarius TaxID=2583219 RepID=A0A549YJD4_9BACI|nr:hypothetical protein [Lentibacillus cibarius]TRM11988.1 hypothetical protein FH966_09985 [Lentibacillus cibarius]
MKTDESNNHFVAGNAEELLSALENKEPYILIPKYFKGKFLENTQLPLTEKEQMGFELGSRGTANLLSSPLFHLINWLSKDSKQQKRIDSKIRKYTLKEQGDNLLLYLRQLDY